MKGVSFSALNEDFDRNSNTKSTSLRNKNEFYNFKGAVGGNNVSFEDVVRYQGSEITELKKQIYATRREAYSIKKVL